MRPSAPGPSSRAPSPRPVDHREGGFALLMVMIAIGVVMVIALSFLATQSTATSVAKTIEDHAQARLTADSGLDNVLAYVHTQADWRTTQASGARWVDEADLADGKVTILGVDGMDGVGDDDLANNDIDPVSFTVTGRSNGAVAVAKAATYPQRRMVMIVPDASDLGPGEAERLALFRRNRWEVTVLGQGTPDAKLGAEMGRADAVYVGSQVDPVVVNTRLNATTAGIVCANPDMADDLKLTTPASEGGGGLVGGLLGGLGDLLGPRGGDELWVQPGTQLVSSGPGTYRYAGVLSPDAKMYAQDQFTGQPSMIGIDVGGQDFGDKFVIDGGTVVSSQAKAAKFTVVGVGFSLMGYNLPVTVAFHAGDKTYEPFGSVDAPGEGDVNDGENPRQFIVPDQLRGKTTLSVSARSWIPDRDAPNDASRAQPFKSISSAADTPNVKLLRDGDPAPTLKGYGDQADAAEFIADYLDPDTHKVTLAPNQAIYLFELATTDMSSDTADFQDLVVVVSLAKEEGDFGEAVGRRLCMPFSDYSGLTDDGEALLLRAMDWARTGRHGPYVVRWE